MNTCRKCNLTKPLDNFVRSPSYKSGHSNLCKECKKKINRDFYFTIDGVIHTIYYTQKASSRYRKMPQPNYSKKQFSSWVKDQNNFLPIFNNWVSNHFAKDYKPSADRLDDFKPYTLDNLRITTWKENRLKGSKDIVNGVNNKNCKAVLQFDIKGNFIKEYHSISEACRVSQADKKSVINCCKGTPKYKTAKGFIWRYK